MTFLRTTLIGGVVFLVPISVLILIFGKAYKLMVRVSEPLSRWLPVETIAGIAKANLLALIAIILVCFVAGLLYKSRIMSRLVRSLESGFLNLIPGYIFIKGFTDGLVDDDEEHLTPIMVRFDDAWQVAFQVEVLADNRVVLFLPGAPNPWSGSIMIMSEDRVQPIETTMAGAIRNLRSLGRGSRELLSTVIIDKNSTPFEQL
jgi:uncharacterized membrane protein